MTEAHHLCGILPKIYTSLDLPRNPILSWENTRQIQTTGHFMKYPPWALRKRQDQQGQIDQLFHWRKAKETQ